VYTWVWDVLIDSKLYNRIYSVTNSLERFACSRSRVKHRIVEFHWILIIELAHGIFGPGNIYEMVNCINSLIFKLNLRCRWCMYQRFLLDIDNRHDVFFKWHKQKRSCSCGAFCCVCAKKWFYFIGPVCKLKMLRCELIYLFIERGVFWIPCL